MARADFVIIKVVKTNGWNCFDCFPALVALVCAEYYSVCLPASLLILDLYITVKLLILLIMEGYLKPNCGEFEGDEGCWCHI